MPHRPTKKPRAPKVAETETRLVPSVNGLRAPGDFCITQRMDDPRITDIYELDIWLPGQRKASGLIVRKVQNVVRTPQAADHVWNWDGNLERPTVNPDIQQNDGRPWRGYLIAGKLVAV